LGGKWLELLSEIAPGLKRAAIMFNPDTYPISTFMPSFETAARSLKVVPSIAPVHNEAVDRNSHHRPWARAGKRPCRHGGDIFMLAHREPIISAAARHDVPAIYTQSDFARDGGLFSYDVDRVDNWRRAASYVDRILRGAKPDDLPVQFPTKFQMVVNRKTANALGLAIPPSIMPRADEVIE
jgi:putative ABC transport system substrate-binding protein